jgi:hypothetical protein
MPRSVEVLWKTVTKSHLRQKTGKKNHTKTLDNLVIYRLNSIESRNRFHTQLNNFILTLSFLPYFFRCQACNPTVWSYFSTHLLFPLKRHTVFLLYRRRYLETVHFPYKLWINLNGIVIKDSLPVIMTVLLQRSLLPGGIILQGVLRLQGSMSVFACNTVRCQLGLLA